MFEFKFKYYLTMTNTTENYIGAESSKKLSKKINVVTELPEEEGKKKTKGKRPAETTPKKTEIEFTGEINNQVSAYKKNPHVKVEYSDKKENDGRGHNRRDFQDKHVENFRKDENNFLNKKRNKGDWKREEERSRSGSRSDLGRERRNTGPPRNFQQGPPHGNRNKPMKGWVCPECEAISFLSRQDCFKCRRRIPSKPLYADLPEKFLPKELRGPSRSPIRGPRPQPVPFNSKRGPAFNEEYKFKSALYNSHSFHPSDKTFKILPKNDPIETEFSYPEISSAIHFLKKVKNAKTEEEKLKLIDSFH